MGQNGAHSSRDFSSHNSRIFPPAARPWIVQVRAALMRNLRISPIGVVPQHERRPRPIVDYSYFGVNDDTVRLAPDEAMQFGRALERILTQIVYANPRYGLIKMIKIDIADGFYRVKVKLEDIPKLGVALPNREGETRLVAFPLALPMGWTQSPPYFCAVTETIADVANERLQQWQRPAPHRLDDLADTPEPAEDPPPTLGDHPPRNPLLPSPNRLQKFVDVFVDDFICGAQGNQRHLRDIRRVLMHAIDDVFRPVDDEDPPYRREPISTDKLKKGGAYWSTRKKILGWIIDTVRMTITLPTRRAKRLEEILLEIRPDQKRLLIQSYHKILGELRSMAITLPGARGLFGALQDAIRHQQDNRLRLTKDFHAAIDDFRWMQQELSHRPTRLQEIVPTPPTIYGSHDASGAGAGGVILPESTAVARPVPTQQLHHGQLSPGTLQSGHPVVWRHRFGKEITDDLVTWTNPHGKINNSELELAGGFLQNEAAAQCFDIRERTAKFVTDNTATLHWMRKGTVTGTNIATKLLQMQALHQRYHRYVHLIDYLPGERNDMADDASRLNHMNDSHLLHHFESRYPQNKPWQLWTIPPQTTSSVTTVLRNKTSPRELWLHEPTPPLATGAFGPTSALDWTWILPYKTSKTHTSKSSPSDIEMASLTPQKRKSDLEQWRMPYAALAKRSNQWGPRILG